MRDINYPFKCCSDYTMLQRLKATVVKQGNNKVLKILTCFTCSL